MPRIIDGNVTLQVTLIHAPEFDSAAPDPRATIESFLSWWQNQCRLRELPPARWAGPDRRLVRQLLDRYGEEKLKRLATGFFRRHVESRERAPFDMVAFAGRIPTIERELSQQA